VKFAALLALAIAPRLATAQSVIVASTSRPDSIAADTTPVMQQGQPRPIVPARRLFDRGDAMLAGGFALATVALFPFDKQVARQFQSHGVQSNATLNSTATTLEKITSPGAYYLGGGLYVVGRLAGLPRLADLGLHATESVVLAEGIGYVLKRTIGRARPYVSDAADPRDFSFGTGFGTGDRRSFPSGHTYTAFAVASAVTSELREWSPRSTWFVAPILYGGAAMVGMSRMYHNQHWASDIALGAAVGTFSGLKLVKLLHANPGNANDRLLLGAPMVSRDANGTKLGWSVKF
jgi:membrane-associated phospholipid phosphatase